jgi:hypothetical protein
VISWFPQNFEPFKIHNVYRYAEAAAAKAAAEVDAVQEAPPADISHQIIELVHPPPPAPPPLPPPPLKPGAAQAPPNRRYPVAAAVIDGCCDEVGICTLNQVDP